MSQPVQAKIFAPPLLEASRRAGAWGTFVAAFLSTAFFAFLPPMMHWRQQMPVWPIGVCDTSQEPMLIFMASALLAGLVNGGIALLSWRKYSNDPGHPHWDSGVTMLASIATRTMLLGLLNVFLYFPLAWTSHGMQFPPELSSGTLYCYLTLTMPTCISTTAFLFSMGRR